MNPALQALSAEASRRGMGMPASNVATRPNPSASQSAVPRPANPLAVRQGMGAAAGAGAGAGVNTAMPSAAAPFAGAAGAMNGAMPGGADHIEKALIKRMNMYPPYGQPKTGV